MNRVILYGYKGFVGSEITKCFKGTIYNVIGINRETFSKFSFAESEGDVVIHCANSARRFYVNNNSQLDLNESTSRTKEILRRHPNSKKILISTISCRTEKDTSYGTNRLTAEDLWLKEGGMVIRLGPMYGGSRTKDTLNDIISNRHVFVARKTKYSYSHVEWNAKYIRKIVEQKLFSNRIIEIGARNTISLQEIAEQFESTSTFSGKIDDQCPEGCADGPNAYDVIEYIEKRLSNER